MEKMKKDTTSQIDLYKIIILLAVIGIGLALYLLYEAFAPAHRSLCYVNSTINCEASTKGALAYTFGIPTALYGLIGYIVIVFSAFVKKRKLLIGMVTFGLLFCLRITFLEIFVIKAICPVCLLCQTNMLILFILALKLPKK